MACCDIFIGPCVFCEPFGRIFAQDCARCGAACSAKRRDRRRGQLPAGCVRMARTRRAKGREPRWVIWQLWPSRPAHGDAVGAGAHRTSLLAAASCVMATYLRSSTQANIAAFGGNANTLTIFGESAGGFSVCQHIVSPASNGLFAAAIIESADCDGPWMILDGPAPFPLRPSGLKSFLGIRSQRSISARPPARPPAHSVINPPPVTAECVRRCHERYRTQLQCVCCIPYTYACVHTRARCLLHTMRAHACARAHRPLHLSAKVP